MADDSHTHIYGGADPDNRQTPEQNGFQGEGKAPLPGSGPVPPHATIVAGGETVTVQEESGVAAVEARGTTGAKQGKAGAG